MPAGHLLWHVGVAAAAVVVLTAFGMASTSALAIGVMAGCVAMLLHGGHSGHDHQSPSDRPAPPREAERR